MSTLITRADFDAWVAALAKDSTVVAPVAADGLVLFRPVTKASEMTIKPGTATLGPKECLFPLSHTIFSVESKDGDVRVVPTTMDRPMVVLGLRPCDAQGLAIFDLPMLQEPADPYYKERREKTTLIGIACATAEPGCFCMSTGGGPSDAKNLDVLLTATPEGFLAEARTDKGRKALESARLTDSNAAAPAPPAMPRVPAEAISKAMRKAFNDKYWSRLADRCTHCNICSYVCPTCYCFDTRDYQEGGKSERVRSWESCQAPGFTKIAGGHDPRGDKGAKMRQRFAHKLFYFPEEFKGVLGCTGCGRCVRQCPVNIDIREIMHDVQKLGGA